MAQAKSKNTTAFAKTADAHLFKLHDTFVKAYETMKQYEGGAGVASLSPATKEEAALYRKWQRAVDDATQKARAVVAAPAVTLEGMLMKIHVAGFTLDSTKAGTFSAPYHGKLCENGPQHWEPGKFAQGDGVALIVSLRNDLHRLSGRRAEDHRRQLQGRQLRRSMVGHSDRRAPIELSGFTKHRVISK